MMTAEGWDILKGAADSYMKVLLGGSGRGLLLKQVVRSVRTALFLRKRLAPRCLSPPMLNSRGCCAALIELKLLSDLLLFLGQMGGGLS